MKSNKVVMKEGRAFLVTEEEIVKEQIERRIRRCNEEERKFAHMLHKAQEEKQQLTQILEEMN